MAGLDDEQMFAVRPEVDEFVRAVAERDPLVVQACLAHTRADVLAVWCAELLADARTTLDRVRGIDPAGISKQRAWEIALESETNKTAKTAA